MFVIFNERSTGKYVTNDGLDTPSLLLPYLFFFVTLITLETMDFLEIWNKFRVTTRNFAFLKFSFPPSLTLIILMWRIG